MMAEKHPTVIAWEKWLRSVEGKRSSNPNTLLAPSEQRQYLENRLQAAFTEGWTACGATALKAISQL